ncbi:MAG: serine dehydratase subunit alpha family protein [Traorella sp.]
MKEYEVYLKILQDELVPAMGCTEPIALAYASSLCSKTLDEEVLSVEAFVSGNIIKNVKSVVVPNTNGLKGIEASIAAGICGGNSDLKLEVISSLNDENREAIRTFLDRNCIHIKPSKSHEVLDIQITCFGAQHHATVRIAKQHTNVVFIQKDEKILFEKEMKKSSSKNLKKTLNVEKIVEFANNVNINDVKALLDRQIQFNMDIAMEGFMHDYGANIGSLLVESYGNDVKIRARALAASGSDARMSGCSKPVVINSGSGNQGITASVPVIVFAKELQVSDEMLYRALVVSNLITIHLKSGIGPLSAYCGAVSAGCGAGCGIAYLYGGDLDMIAHTLVNAIAIGSGIVCDGAKPSCASKIALSVDAGIMGYLMASHKKEFKDGEGLVLKGVENTISNISRLSQKGMKKTDQEIIQMMCKC